jgi:hypothetical protein
MFPLHAEGSAEWNPYIQLALRALSLSGGPCGTIGILRQAGWLSPRT